MSIKFVKLKPAETYTHTHTHTHTSKALLSFLSIILISAPAFSYVTNSSQCDNDVLSTYSGSANLTANWQGNPITVTWYNDDTQYASNSCTYGGDLTMPSSIPQKTGYTFKGWRVRQASGGQQAQQCGLSHVDTSIDADWDADHIAWQPINGSSGWTVAQAIDNGDINPGTDHSSELSNGEWRIIFSYGTVKGMSKCSDTSGTSSTVGRPSDTNGKYCWCAATSYTPSGGSACNVASPSWVFVNDVGSASDCAFGCAAYCASFVMAVGDFRRAVFGVSQ